MSFSRRQFGEKVAELAIRAKTILIFEIKTGVPYLATEFSLY